MKIAFRVAGLAVLAGAGFWLWTVLFPSPEKVVLKKVRSLAATASVNSNDGAFTRAAKVSNLIGFFSPEAEINYDISGVGTGSLTGRDEIRETAAGGYTHISNLNVQFTDATAHVAADKQNAEVSCTARVSTGDSRDFGVQELRFQFQKLDRDWLITRVDTVKTLH